MSLTLTRRHNVDRFGYLIPTRYGNVPMVGAVATYRPGEGRFGGAVAVEEGTTNKHASEGGGAAQNWSLWSHWGNRSFWQSETQYDDPAMGKVYEGVNANGSETFLFDYYPYTYQAGVAYTGSIYLKADRQWRGQLRFYLNQGSNNAPLPGGQLSKQVTLDTQWRRFEFTVVPTAAPSGGGGMGWRLGGFPVGAKLYAAKPQLEQKPYATSFVDGTRAAGRLSYPKSLIAGLNALTVAAWTSGPPYWVSGYRYLVAAQTTDIIPHGDVFALRQTGTNNRIILWVRNDANSSTAEIAYDNVWDGNWHLIVGVINKSPQPGRRPIELYVDGKLVASSSNVNAVPDLSNIDETWGVQVGNWRGSLPWNGLIDELLLLPYAASEEEIRAWYEADGPIPPHPAALLQWDWQAVRPATMVAL